MLSGILAGIGSLFSSAATSFSWFFIHDEAETPKSLIK